MINYLNNLSESNSINFVYLITLLGFLSASLIVHLRNKPITTLKHLSIWAFIICILILLYSYRHEFNNIKNRFLGELLPNHPTLNQDGSISIRISQDGHYHANIYINDQEINFMIDTGASDIVLSKKDAEKIGITTSNLKYSKIYNTANGTSYGAPILLSQIKIGNFILTNIPASVNSGKMENSLLGMDFLKRLREYNVKESILTLYP